MTLSFDGWKGAALATGGIILAVLIARCSGSGCGKTPGQREREREDEAGVIHGAGLPTFDPLNPFALLAQLEAEKQKSEGFKKALDETSARLKKATGKAPRVVEVIRWRTKPGEAGGEPRPGTPTCLVAPGDKLDIRGTEARFETRAGNLVPVGLAEVYRLLPPPETRIYSQPIAFEKLARERPADPAPNRPLMIGVAGSYGTGGYGFGPMLGYQFSRVGATIGGTFGEDQRVIGSVFARF